MKVTYHMPTEQFGYIEFDLEVDSIHEALLKYHSSKEAPVGLPDKEFNGFIDNMLKGDSNHVEVYNQMNPKQQEIVQAIKRGIKRIKDKQI